MVKLDYDDALKFVLAAIEISTQIALQLRINFELSNWKWKNLENVKSSRGEERRVLVGQVFHHQNSRYFVTLNMSHCKDGHLVIRLLSAPKKLQELWHTQTHSVPRLLDGFEYVLLWRFWSQVICASICEVAIFLKHFWFLQIPSEFSWNSK